MNTITTDIYLHLPILVNRFINIVRERVDLIVHVIYIYIRERWKECSTWMVRSNNVCEKANPFCSSENLSHIARPESGLEIQSTVTSVTPSGQGVYACAPRLV
jgi:hypothetical protein